MRHPVYGGVVVPLPVRPIIPDLDEDEDEEEDEAA